MANRGQIALIFFIVLFALPFASKRADFELLSQEATGASGPMESAAWDTLQKGVDDGDAKRRVTAISAIGTIGAEPEAVKLVVRGLEDKSADVRQTAAATLGQMGAHDTIARLKALLDDESPQVSFTAAKALSDLGDSSGRDIVQAVMAGERSDRPGKLHSALADAKHRLRPSQLALMGAKEGAGVFFGPAGTVIDAVQEAMEESKKDTAAPGRAAAAAILAKDPDPYSLILLEWGLGDKNWAVRVAVAKALGVRGSRLTIVKLSPLLSDDHHEVRYMAAASMVKLNLKAPNPSGS